MMEQTNVDYLFQVTAALAERSAADSSESGRAAFGDHFARATESARGDKSISAESSRSKEERPPQRSEFGSKPGGSYASDDASDSAEYASCAEPNPSESCGDADHESRDEEAKLAEPATAEAADSSADSSVENEPGDAESGEGAGDVQGSLEHALAGANAAAEVAKDTTFVSTAAIEADSSAETTAQSEGARPGSADAGVGERALLPGIGEALIDAGDSTVAVQQHPGKLPSVESAGTTAANAATGEASATESRTHRESSANKQESSEQSKLSRNLATASNALQSTGEAASSTEKASSSRRTAAKRVNEDSARRSNDGGEQRAVQRADPGAASQIAGAMQNAAPSDARSAQAAGSGDESTVASTKLLDAKGDLHPHALGHGPVSRNGRTGDAPALPRVDSARFVGRVAKAIQTASERGGSLNLRLSPPELGSLRLQLSVDNGVMSATLEADSSAARQILLDHLPALRDRLAEQNIRIERFDVDVRQDGSSGQSDARASQHDGRDQQPHHANHRRQHTSAHAGDELPRDPIPRQSRGTTNGINLLA